MTTSKTGIVSCFLLGVVCSTALGAEIKLKPVSATGSHSIVGNTIILDTVPQCVFLEVTISGWDPDLDGTPRLHIWQAGIDSSGYSSGLAGTLSPASAACTLNGDCLAPFGGVCTASGGSCLVDTDCPYYPYGIETCGGAPCDYPFPVGGYCSPGFQWRGRLDGVLLGAGCLPAVEVSTLNFRYGSLAFDICEPMVDPGTPGYGGTLVLEVPADAWGTFTVKLKEAESFLRAAPLVPIEPLTLTPALIAVRCYNSAECEDTLFCTESNACVDGVCTGLARDCSYLNDQCNLGVCDEELDTCLPQPRNEGLACDDGESCNVGETCQSGTCTGGGPPDCSGAGNDCNTASCDPLGAEGNCDVLTPANEGLPCDDVYCTVGELFCTSGNCGGGTDRDCADTVDCTDDWCDEVGDTCVHDPNDALCPDDGLWCNGSEYCHVTLDCQHTGSPCSGTCDEENDKCLCETPIVEAFGGRYLRIAPQPYESGPQAILITPNCPSGDPKYVGEPIPVSWGGEFVGNFAQPVDDPDNAAWHTPPEWGELGRVYVYGLDVVPNTPYFVQGDCGVPGSPGLSDQSLVTTPKWGDATGDGGTPPDGIVDFVDVAAIVDGFKGSPDAPPIYSVDLMGAGVLVCLPSQRVDFLDISSAMDGFRGLSYSQSFPACPRPCP